MKLPAHGFRHTEVLMMLFQLQWLVLKPKKKTTERVYGKENKILQNPDQAQLC
jgi:hypothetical protein